MSTDINVLNNRNFKISCENYEYIILAHVSKIGH